MIWDDSIYHAVHDNARSVKGEESAPSSVSSSSPRMRLKKFSTLEVKTHFSRIMREMERGDFDGAVITSYGRRVGILFPERMIGDT